MSDIQLFAERFASALEARAAAYSDDARRWSKFFRNAGVADNDSIKAATLREIAHAVREAAK